MKAPAAAPGSGTHAAHRPSRRLTWLAAGWFAFWVLVAGLVVVPHMYAYPQLSPFDEQVHVDYFDKAGRFELVTAGEKLGETAMREQACRGHDTPSIELPPCGSEDLEPEQFPSEGYNTAYGDPPTYYYATAWVAAALELLPGLDGAVATGRAVGVLWLGCGLAVLFLLALRLGATPLAAAGVGLVVASSPVVVHASATITSDAPALLVGGGLCLTAVGVLQGRVQWWWLIPAAAAATAVKVTSLTVVGAVVVFLLLGSRRGQQDPGTATADASGHRTSGWRWRSVIATAGGAALPVLGWAVFLASTSPPGAEELPMSERFRVSSIGWSEVAANFFALVTPLKNGYVPVFMESATIFVLIVTVELVLLSAVAAVSWYGARHDRTRQLAGATLISMVVSGPVLVVLFFVAAHSYVPIPPRYGLSLAAPAAACLAVVASGRRGGPYALLALGCAGMAALLVQTV